MEYSIDYRLRQINVHMNVWVMYDEQVIVHQFTQHSQWQSMTHNCVTIRTRIKHSHIAHPTHARSLTLVFVECVMCSSQWKVGIFVFSTENRMMCIMELPVNLPDIECEAPNVDLFRICVNLWMNSNAIRLLQLGIGRRRYFVNFVLSCIACVRHADRCKPSRNMMFDSFDMIIIFDKSIRIMWHIASYLHSFLSHQSIFTMKRQTSFDYYSRNENAQHTRTAGEYTEQNQIMSRPACVCVCADWFLFLNGFWFNGVGQLLQAFHLS